MIMSRRARGAVCLVASLLLCCVALVACGEEPEPTIADKVIGWWQETGTAEAFTLHITRDGTAAAQQYQVEYPRSFLVPFYAYLKGDKLLIWGENTTDIVWTVTYDPMTDHLQAGRGHETISFRRIKGQQ
jgi:hypothetical protein